MGLLGKAVKKTVAKKVVKKAAKIIDEKYSADALLKKKTTYNNLLVKQKRMAATKCYNVYDKANNESVKKYTIKMDSLSFGYPILRLYDTQNKEIGRIETTDVGSSNFRGFSIYLNNSKIGVVTRQFSTKIKLDIDFNGWRVEGSFVKLNANVFDKENNTVIKISRAFESTDVYVVEYKSWENETIAILLFMVFEAILNLN